MNVFLKKMIIFAAGLLLFFVLVYLQNPYFYNEKKENTSLQMAIFEAEQKMQTDPMQGIFALVELAEKYPENFQLQKKLGVFSWKTFQYEKAMGRFQKAWKLTQEKEQKQEILSFFENINEMNIEAKEKEKIKIVLLDWMKDENDVSFKKAIEQYIIKLN